MKNTILIITLLFSCFTVGQKKKDLLQIIDQLQNSNTELQSKLTAIEQAKKLNLADEVQKFSYAMGTSIGSGLKTSGVDSISYNAFIIALKDVMNNEGKMDPKDADQLIRTTFQKKLEEKSAALKKEGEAFLAENAKRPEVKTTESGLQYEILTAGEGAKPSATDQVKVHYTGMLIDGKVFDSSVDRGEPIDMQLSSVIQAWQEGLQLMPVGAKWKLFVPYDLGYGETGAGGGTIPPYATLIFEVELLEIL